MNHVPYSLIAAVLLEDGEESAEHLAALADLACASGDRKRAEELIERLYAYYDRRQGLIATLAESANLLQKLRG